MEIKICKKCKNDYRIKNAKESYCRTNCAICGEFDWYYEINVEEVKK